MPVTYFSSPAGFGGGGGGPAIADFNLDGKLDIAANNSVLLGNGGGTFQGVPLGLVPATVSEFGVVGDFEKDGKPDVAVLSQNTSNSLYILRNKGSGALTLINTYQLQQPGYGIVTADLNGDGNLDLVLFGTDPITQEWSYSVLLGSGNGSFQPAVFYPQNVETECVLFNCRSGF